MAWHGSSPRCTDASAPPARVEQLLDFPARQRPLFQQQCRDCVDLYPVPFDETLGSALKPTQVKACFLLVTLGQSECDVSRVPTIKSRADVIRPSDGAAFSFRPCERPNHVTFEAEPRLDPYGGRFESRSMIPTAESHVPTIHCSGTIVTCLIGRPNTSEATAWPASWNAVERSEL